MGNIRKEAKKLFWQIRSRDESCAALPSGDVTRSNPVTSHKMPPEIALLLPGPHCDPQSLEFDEIPKTAAVGEFLANPIVNVPKLVRNLKDQEIEWVTNIPSLSQHDADFRQDLSDVSLSFDQEMTALAQIGLAGFKTLATVGTGDNAMCAIEHGVDTLFVLPGVSAFRAGFPSPRTRSGQIAKIRAKLPDLDIPLLGLICKTEAALPDSWPDGLDAVVLRPEPL